MRGHSTCVMLYIIEEDVLDCQLFPQNDGHDWH